MNIDTVLVKMPGETRYGFIQDLQGDKKSDYDTFFYTSFEDDILYKINGRIQYFNNITEEIKINFINLNTYTGILDISKDEYINQAKEIIAMCRMDKVQKVVLSRHTFSPVVKKINSTYLFEIISKLYPNFLVVLLNSEKFGTWLGASPEPLLAFSNGQYITDALAGTRKKEIKFWTQKEKNEHELVAKHIENTLTINHINFVSREKVLAMGDIEHIQRRYSWEEISLNKQFAFKLCSHLSPTPAVCGFPVKLAKNLIGKIEKHRRDLYTGYWGLSTTDNRFLSYVNLRCCRIYSNGIGFYAGGGINSLSNEEKEWDETEQKIDLLRNSLLSIY